MDYASVMTAEDEELHTLIEQIIVDGVKAANICLPSNFTIKRWFNDSVPFYPEPMESNFPQNFAIFLAVCGIIANAVSLAAMMHISGSFTSNQKLVFNLLLSNFFISVTLLLVVWNSILFPSFPSGKNGDDWSLCQHVIMKSLVMMGHSISLLNLVALAFDHFMAINKPLKYIQVFTNHRVSVSLLGVWIISGIFGFSDFILPVPYYSYCEGHTMVNLCQSSYCSAYETEYLLFCLVILCFLAMVYFYCRVFVKIYKYQQMAGRHQRKMKRNIKGLVTTLVIVGTFLVCWLPHAIFETYFVFMILADTSAVTGQFYTLLTVNYYLYWLWLLNSICDPVIYALRMREVKLGYYRMLRCGVLTKRFGKFSRKSHSSLVYRRSGTPSMTCDVAEATLNVTFSSCNSSAL
ncbi:glucose-dependent insulinotropic receptor-like [Liolophura sinensis]|uniref:glucose-dependent insulinotropic receptor-like n=1 Tax=Liolophura sinensis TaxID=3198878 RepID=UPI0031584EB8